MKYSPILLLSSVGGHAMPKIVGTNDADTIVGTEENDRIWALAGNDIVDGGCTRHPEGSELSIEGR
ncbi:hypothetical protein [Brucella anthropi]|uniref:hypothetical protein n=1 Tax=Brucella anthropi TaxID=529 RepID=UPI0035B559BA